MTVLARTWYQSGVGRASLNKTPLNKKANKPAKNGKKVLQPARLWRVCNYTDLWKGHILEKTACFWRPWCEEVVCNWHGTDQEAKINPNGQC